MASSPSTPTYCATAKPESGKIKPRLKLTIRSAASYDLSPAPVGAGLNWMDPGDEQEITVELGTTTEVSRFETMDDAVVNGLLSLGKTHIHDQVSVSPWVRTTSRCILLLSSYG